VKSTTGMLVVALLLLTSTAALAVVDNADSLYVGPGETYTLGGAHSYNIAVEVAATGTLYVAPYDGSPGTGALELLAPEVLVAGTINGDERGYRKAEGPGRGSDPGGGGAYGGDGGASGWGNPGGTAYGTSDGYDLAMGSGGADQTLGIGGRGGAMVALRADTVDVSGLVTVNGEQGSDVTGWGDGGGGGAGGGILLQAEYMRMSGMLCAEGGRGGDSVQRRGGGGGGGGRIKLFHCYIVFSGGHSVAGGAGGIGGWPANGSPGQDGTYYSNTNTTQFITSIEDVENDQGRQVRISWNRSCLDDPDATDPVTHYTIWRRIDPVAGSRTTEDGPPRLTYPPGDWDYVAEVPARGEDTYNAIAPTLADSNASGMHWSVFFVSGVTADPFVYYDCGPDSGCSVDNLSPAPPEGFACTRIGDENQLVWEESLEEDFDYYALHRGDSEGFVPDETNLIVTQSGTDCSDTAPALSYYKLAAVDFNGNVSSYALAPPDVADVPGQPADLMLRVHSPVSNEVSVEFALPADAPASISLYDVAGRLISRRDVTRAPGEYAAVVAGGSELASGVYFVRLEQGGATREGRVVVIK